MQLTTCSTSAEPTAIMTGIVGLYLNSLILPATTTLSTVMLLFILGKRFLDFPAKRYCCFCCDSTHGCGIVEPDWIGKSNGTYQGTEKLEDGKTYLKWEIKGLQSNFYYHANDTNKTPRRLVQGSDDQMDFTDYYIGIKDPSVFRLPSYCTEKCGLTTICAGLRDAKKNLLKSEWWSINLVLYPFFLNHIHTKWEEGNVETRWTVDESYHKDSEASLLLIPCFTEQG